MQALSTALQMRGCGALVVNKLVIVYHSVDFFRGGVTFFNQGSQQNNSCESDHET